MSDKELSTIKTTLINHAIYFLENIGEFYPFGIALLENNEIIYHGVIDEDLVSEPTSELLIDRVSNKLFYYLDEKQALGIGLALNTSFTKKDSSETINTIEIRILYSEGMSYNIYIEYLLENSIVSLLRETSTPWIA